MISIGWVHGSTKPYFRFAKRWVAIGYRMGIGRLYILFRVRVDVVLVIRLSRLRIVVGRKDMQ